jgi:hypothetical protein
MSLELKERQTESQEKMWIYMEGILSVKYNPGQVHTQNFSAGEG